MQLIETNETNDSYLNFSFEVSYNLEHRIPNVWQIILIKTDDERKTLCENRKCKSLSLCFQNQNHYFTAHFFLPDADTPIIIKTKVLLFNVTAIDPHVINVTIENLQLKKPIYTCTEDLLRSTIFDKMNLNETHPFFEPQCDKPTESITEVYLEGSIHTLTSDICDKFVDIESFYAWEIGLKNIHIDAFKGCSKLRELKLSGNELTTIPKDFLINNSQLSTLDLQNNKLSNIDGDFLRHTPLLEFLFLNGNQLTKFPFIYMPVMEKLEKITIGRNNLSYLSPTETLRSCPMLKYVIVSDQDFDQKKLQVINDIFVARNVRFMST